MKVDIDKLNEKLEEHEKRIRKLESRFEENEIENTSEISINELFRSKNPKNDVQKTLIIGYYLKIIKNLECFNTKDIEKVFKAAREKLPANIPDKINKNIRKGHIMECVGDKDKLKSYKITQSGRNYLENNFKE